MTNSPNSKSTPRRKIGKPFIKAWVDKTTGYAYYYFRRKGYPSLPLPGHPGSAEFELAYQAALGTPPAAIGVNRNRPGSVAHAVASYFGSTDFNNLKSSTREIRRVVLEKFRRDHGDMPIAKIGRAHV